MEALLGASQSNPSCGSVAELQARLRDLFSTRVTETRADHISVTFEIRATAVFDIPIADSENAALGNASNIDPLLGGARPSVAPVEDGSGGQATRRVNAIDSIINQPHDDPALQTSIVRHIIASLGQVGESSWIVRQVSRAEQGWTFTYICKDSWQAWSRQASKHPAKMAVGEWSEKGGQDPAHLARPAFDCRGSVKIAFVKSTKTIDVKFEHTPVHWTVAQLIELLAPPPVAPIVKTPAKTPAKPREPRPPKQPRPPKEPKAKTPRSSKKRTGENGTPAGEGSQRKKRSKKGAAAAGPSVPPEMEGALPVGDSARQLYNTQTGTPGGSQSAGSISYPEGLVGSADNGTADGDVHAHSVLNLPPREAARRREAAIKLLSDSGIDPKSLSAEQFNIFANQSPELQQDSLAMLVKYGAERLRIVHPKKDGSASGESTPNKENTPVSAEASPQSTKAQKARKKKSAVEEAGAVEQQAPEAAKALMRKRMCDNCREKKYKAKCDRGKPCSMCIADGAVCAYSPARRPKKAAEDPPESADQVEEMPNDEPDDLGSPSFHADSTGQPAPEPFHHTLSHEHFDGHAHQTANEHVPETIPETPSNVFDHSHTVYHQASDLSFPQGNSSSAPEPTHSSPASTAMMPPSMEYVGETRSNNFHSLQPPAAPQAASGYAEQAPPAFEQGLRPSSRGQASTSRRPLPIGQPSHGSGASSADLETQNTWQPMSSTPAQAVSAIRTSPRQSRAKKPAPGSQSYDDLRPQQASSWVSANQSVPVTTQPARNSSSQTAAQPARSKSRQSSRTQNHTPADNSGYASATTAQQPSSTQSYDNYNQYQSGNTQADTSSDRVAYQPYANNQTTGQSNSYSSFDNYNSRVPNTTASSSSASWSQNVASSYASNPAATTSTAQWGSSNSTPQARNARGYDTTQSATGNAYSSSNPSQPQSRLQGFNARPQSQTQAGESSGTDNQQLHQQQQRQQQGQPQPQQQQQQQQQGYNGYINNVTQQPQQQQQQPANSNQQSWGYNTFPSPSSAATASSHGHGHQTAQQQQQQQQQHRSMNLSSRTYGGMELYDLIRNNPA